MPPVEITMNPIASSQMKAAGYDPETQTMAVEFNSGSVYHYANVQQSHWDEFATSQSKGRYLGQVFKAQPEVFTCTKVKGPGGLPIPEEAAPVDFSPA